MYEVNEFAVLNVSPYGLIIELNQCKSVNPLFVGHAIIEYDHLDSTNSHALKVLRDQNVPEGTVFFTPRQTAGRGQMNNHWYSKPFDSLTFSLVLYPHFLQATDQFQLNKAVSLALYDYLSGKVDGVRIKWPNDLLIDGKKVGGILIENQLKGALLSQSVIGIGLNFNQRRFPLDLPEATSLYRLTREMYSVRREMHQLFAYLEARYLQIRHSRRDLRADYFRVLHRNSGWFEYEDATGRFEAEIVGVEPSGRLILRDRTDQQRAYAFKEVRFV